MEVQVIQVKEQEKKRIRVAAYARISTDHPEQENSIENQITHYEEVIQKNPDYELIEIYHDTGISGFKEKRPGFQKMLADARKHRFDLILTKSITRFARNTDTILKATRELKELGIGVFFELQNINSLTQAGELLMTIYAAFGQEESTQQSRLCRMVYEKKYEAGIPVQYLERSFGYKKADDGSFVPDENARWVKRIFELGAKEYSLSEIARYMNEKGIRTKQGALWKECTVERILESAIYKGDFIMQQHFVNDERKLVVNRGERKQWYVENDHEPIVSRELWQKAQMARGKKREYLAKAPEVKELTKENYPYMKRIFCGKCGRPLYPKIYSGGRRLSWICSGRIRFTKEFCEGVRVPDSVIAFWNPKENIYVKMEKDELGKKSFHYRNEKTFLHDCHGKPKKTPKQPEHVRANYPFKDHVRCKYCGYKLTRARSSWICSGQKHHGKAFCRGVGYVPDNVLQKLGALDHDIFIGKEIINGKERYGYSQKPDEFKKWHRPE